MRSFTLLGVVLRVMALSVQAHPFIDASVCSLFTALFFQNGVHDSLRLILFVSTDLCSLAYFSAYLTVNHLATC